MKKIYIIIFALVAGHYCTAQQSGQNELIIPFNSYFESDSVTETSVNLNAKQGYIDASMQTKQFIIDNVLSSRNRKVAFISYGDMREIWGKDAYGSTVLLDSINMNGSDLGKVRENSQKLIRHPWFFYFGGQGMYNSDYLSLSFNVRTGFFLLLNKWDLALSQGLNISDTENNTTTNISIGLSSKYYFPMTFKGQRISPYFGGSIGYAYVNSSVSGSDTDTEEWQPDYSAMAGVSWALGPGSLDVGVQYGKTSKLTITAGYTFFPWRR
ncbi:MAG: porin family protein [Prevotellaceae bacterium]|nr:porin family protein [Prevotellaceae bacterium]